MISWINIGVLVTSTALFTCFYLASVRIAKLEKKIGDRAYKRATLNRIISALFMTLAAACYVCYFFFPLPVPVLNRFPWPWWISAAAGGLLVIPAFYLWFKGMADAGKGTMVVTKEFKPYAGIYKRIRHPQAAGELLVWWVMAFFLHSPFLALYSIIWIPLFIWVCLAEEADLIKRYGKAYTEYAKNTGFFTLK
ncbi:hypothetical protein GF359_05305 [candidate division WOR-3 bacterium]|uniref:Isoprenylcysteine carboxylmethyltransferase family protein n=1 Tax=candidate division WOR-3 bacterium TaxID=2052148 RepID=A0A9D5K945_UNCW3|nr:hypothetical protein [candidate division WOR-3 bacterium]MBD3364613.1 hypothetical protein [candidate division WOR-3 bacterium]